jgi:amidophosphoribosyltransferase
VRDAGALEVHLRISCPPTISPCYYGVDTPHSDELIAANYTVEEVCEYIKADSLGYLSLEGMIEATGIEQGAACVACWTAKYPIPLEKPEEELCIANVC